MVEVISTLLSISSPPLSGDEEMPGQKLVDVSPHLSGQLFSLLKQKNGFFAFENALHVFPLGKTDFGYDLTTWNSTNLWRSYYLGLADAPLFFAEDVFGEQFAIYQELIHRFNPETGLFTQFAPSLNDWAERILDSYDLEVGYTIGHNWQTEFEPLQPSHRLLPKVPFLLGGKFVIENLYSLDAAQGMRFRSDMANKTTDIPDGSKIVLKVID